MTVQVNEEQLSYSMFSIVSFHCLKINKATQFLSLCSCLYHYLLFSLICLLKEEINLCLSLNSNVNDFMLVTFALVNPCQIFIIDAVSLKIVFNHLIRILLVFLILYYLHSSFRNLHQRICLSLMYLQLSQIHL